MNRGRDVSLTGSRDIRLSGVPIEHRATPRAAFRRVKAALMRSRCGVGALSVGPSTIWPLAGSSSESASSIRYKRLLQSRIN